MSAPDLTRTFQQFLAAVASVERSRFARALLADPAQYVPVFHQQAGDPDRPVAVPDADAEVMRRILDLATDRSAQVSLSDVGSALALAATVRAIPERLPDDWRDARARIDAFLALTGPLPGPPEESARAEGPSRAAPAAFRAPADVSREELLRVVIEGGVRPTDEERTRTFRDWRAAPPFFTVVEQVFVASLADLIQTLSAMRQYIVQPAAAALVTAGAPAAKPFDTA